MKPKTIKQEFDEYLKTCYAPGYEFKGSQLAQVYQAFLGGALVAMTTMIQIAKENPQEQAEAFVNDMFIDITKEARDLVERQQQQRRKQN